MVHKIKQRILTNPSSPKIAPVYFENLDALRFVAAFSVFIFHFFRDIYSFYPNLRNNFIFDKLMILADKGALGVNFFFVLSGFLITYLILDEKKRTGGFSLANFLLRRTLRIWPLYFLVIGIGFLLFPAVIEGYYTVHDPVYYLFFLANFDEIRVGLQDPVNFLTAPWSIAVEEQFYLFWGTALFFLLRSRRFRMEYLVLFLTIISLVFRWFYRDEERVIYYHTLSVCQDLLTGSFIGLSLFQGRQWVNRVLFLSRWQILLIYLAGLLVIVVKNKLFSGELVILERLVLSAFFGFVILEQSLGRNSLLKAGKLPYFTPLGRISYGLYMYHLIVLFLVSGFISAQGWTGYYLIPVYFVVTLSGTILAAQLSYHLIEKPFLRLKPARKVLT